MKKILLAALVSVAMSGCATQVTEAGYYWGNYSGTLYQLTKNPSEEAVDTHVAELEIIVEESRERHLKVPPGIHAELGYILAKKGNSEAATAHYQSEIELYPESRVFLERLTATKTAALGE